MAGHDDRCGCKRATANPGRRRVKVWTKGETRCAYPSPAPSKTKRPTSNWPGLLPPALSLQPKRENTRCHVPEMTTTQQKRTWDALPDDQNYYPHSSSSSSFWKAANKASISPRSGRSSGFLPDNICVPTRHTHLGQLRLYQRRCDWWTT